VSDGVKRFWIIGNEAYSCKQEDNAPLAFHTHQIEVMPVTDHDRIVAELRAEVIEPVSGNSYKELYDYANAFAAELQEKNDDLEKQIERLKTAPESNVSASVYESAVKGRSDFRQALKEARQEIARQAREAEVSKAVIEKLSNLFVTKDFIWSDPVSRLGKEAAKKSADIANEKLSQVLAAIEKGEW
jgi:DNA repair exonuclease SbcCD ATPase subunit